MGIVFFDTETTGLMPGYICQLSLIHEENLRVVGCSNYFFKVDYMDSSAQAIHGYSKEMLDELSGGKVFGDHKDELYKLFSENTLSAYNLPFDERFMTAEFGRSNMEFTPGGRFDLMDYYKNVLKIPAKNTKYGPYKNPKLSEVAEFYKIDMDAAFELTRSIFKDCENTTFHDSTFDTTIMYILVNLERESKANGSMEWHKRFTKGSNINI